MKKMFTDTNNIVDLYVDLRFSEKLDLTFPRKRKVHQ